MLLLQARDNDYQSLEKILETNTFERPTIKLSVYKNRRGNIKVFIYGAKLIQAVAALFQSSVLIGVMNWQIWKM